MAENKAAGSTVTAVRDRELIVTRSFNAPRELVYELWTKPEHLPQWWGPKGFTLTMKEIDVKPGGVWSYIMHGPDGTDYNNLIRYIEVEQPERLVYSHGDGSEDDNPFHVTVTFDDRGSQTELTMRMLFPSAEELDKAVKQYGAVEGAKQTLDRMEEQLSKLL